jgi:hypothetical protein
VSANNMTRPRRAGAPVFPKPKLRLVENTDERPRPQPDSDLRTLLEDIQRRRHAPRADEPDGKDAA